MPSHISRTVGAVLSHFLLKVLARRHVTFSEFIIHGSKSRVGNTANAIELFRYVYIF